MINIACMLCVCAYVMPSSITCMLCVCAFVVPSSHWFIEVLTSLFPYMCIPKLAGCSLYGGSLAGADMFSFTLVILYLGFRTLKNLELEHLVLGGGGGNLWCQHTVGFPPLEPPVELI